MTPQHPAGQVVKANVGANYGTAFEPLTRAYVKYSSNYGATRWEWSPLTKDRWFR